jgi:hypothetical protein
MDVVKAERDPDVATRASSVGGNNTQRNVKDKPQDVSLTSTNQENEVRNITSLLLSSLTFRNRASYI